ncbi:MAG TPA: hypothetical protein VKB96_10310 [Gammaproteobacteria bacterium]|nr:hypothetical protein [Gammaproteobacteria bacterium]
MLDTLVHVDLDLNAPFLDAIADAAAGLLKLKDNPTAQRELIKLLNQEQSMALCMWILDTSIEE